MDHPRRSVVHQAKDVTRAQRDAAKPMVASPTRHTHTDFEDRLEDVTEPEFEREKVVEIHLTANAVKIASEHKGQIRPM